MSGYANRHRKHWHGAGSGSLAFTAFFFIAFIAFAFIAFIAFFFIAFTTFTFIDFIGMLSQRQSVDSVGTEDRLSRKYESVGIRNLSFKAAGS